MYILIDINSDLDPVVFTCDSDQEIAIAKVALRDAGLAYEDVWVGDPECPDSYRNGQKLFAAAKASVR